MLVQFRYGVLVMSAKSALLGVIQLVVRVGVSVSVVVALLLSAVRMTVSSKYHKSDQVRGEAEAANNQDDLRVRNLGRVEEARNCFENDGDAEGDQEDGIEEGAQNLCAQPAVRVLVGGCLLSEVDGPQADEQRYDVVEHVEGIGHQRQGVDQETGDQLDEEERRADPEHDLYTDGLGPGHDGWWGRAPVRSNDGKWSIGGKYRAACP